MSNIDATTQSLLDTIEENQPKIKEAGFNGGFEDGSKAAGGGDGLSWDEIQNYGTRTSYRKGFVEWGIEELSPKHVVRPTGACSELFYNCKNLKSIDGNKFDLSQATYSPTDSSSAGCYVCYNCSSLEVFPDIGLQAGMYNASFYGCTKLHTIEVLRVTEDCKFITLFSTTRQLENINRIEGFIGTNFDVRMCTKLSPASMKNIIKHLKNEGYTFTNTVYFSKTAFEALEADGFNAEDEAWHVEAFGAERFESTSWEAVIALLGWNLTTR